MQTLNVQVHNSRPAQNMRHQTSSLLRRMLSPICGLSTSIGFTLSPPGGARIMTAGGDMTGVHVLNGTRKPKRGFYHIGGSGSSLEESVIRTLGETAERYSQFISPRKFGKELRWCSWEQLVSEGAQVLSPALCQFYQPERYTKPSFPYKPFSAGQAMSWIAMPSMLGPDKLWVPTQLVLVGYVVRDDIGEPWLTSAVTTGGAAHTDPAAALRNAILEHIQVDTAMGHWYSQSESTPIELDARTARLGAFVSRYFRAHGPQPRFYYLRNADMPGHCVACTLRDPKGVPRIGVGLGCDTALEASMYSALLEAVGVYNLAKLNLLEAQIGSDGVAPTNTEELFDLDKNVAWYALPQNAALLDRRYPLSQGVAASKLPKDDTRPVKQQLATLVEAFRRTNKTLVYLDLTTSDLHNLGFYAFRVWSPELLSLAMPSAPKDSHPRYAAYGGYRADSGPHPYP